MEGRKKEREKGCERESVCGSKYGLEFENWGCEYTKKISQIGLVFEQKAK